MPLETLEELERNLAVAPAALRIRDFSLWYGDFQALSGVSLDVPRNKVTAFIGPSGCGKSTLLRALNRMCDFTPGVRTQGVVEVDGRDVRSLDGSELRVRVGMVFQHPNPFPLSIRENVLYGPRRAGRLSRERADELVRTCLEGAGLWDEVKDKLGRSGLSLSGGQQQRLCIARALATDPDVLLMDEPTSALDPISTALIEELMVRLACERTVVAVTHNMQQAARVADKTAFFYLGKLVEEGPTKRLFSRPREQRTKDYLTGRFS